MRARLGPIAALGLLVAATGAPGPTKGSPVVPRFRADSPFIRDAAGRAVFFHGVNAVWKLPPYYPRSTLFGWPADQSYFDERDAQFLAENGLNSVRLGVLWAGVEPERDRFDESYLGRIEQIVDLLAPRGVTVLLDFHQDMYNERFQGEGFPAWATHTEVPETNCCGFPGNYFTPAVMRAFDNLWLDHDGLWDEFRDFWVHVAGRFKGKANVVGYDLLNEPWPGTQWPTCANLEGCPAFDAGIMQQFYEHAIAGIRSTDPSGIIWWEPNVTNDFGAANGVGLVSRISDPGASTGVSFHAYCLFGGLFPGVSRADDPACPRQEERTFQEQHEAAARNGSGLFLTEFGASDDLVDIGRMAAFADRFMVSWHYWHYGSWSDPTGNPAEEGMFANDLDRPGSLKQAKADLLIRAYPQAVAGTPMSFAFDPATKVFTLTYRSDPSITEPSVIFLPVARHYAGHYAVEVTGPARVTSGPDAPLLTLANTGPGTVTVTVTKPQG